MFPISNVKRFHVNELGMSSVQVVATIAVAAVVMLSLARIGRRGSDWMQQGFSGIEQRAGAIDGDDRGVSTAGAGKPIVVSNLNPKFGRSAELIEPSVFRSVLFEDSDTKTHLAVAGVAENLDTSGTGQLPPLNRFDTPEHERFGELAATKAQITPDVRFGNDYSITFAEMVTMADFFESDQQLWEFATTPGLGPGTREEVEYIRLVKIQGKKKLKSKFSKEAIEAAENRYKWLAHDNKKHFQSPREEFANLSPTRQPDSAGRTFLQHHLSAIGAAIAAGRDGQTMNTALRKEAFGAHFLTDAVSAGHVRVPRLDVKTWWNDRDPGLNKKFQGYLAEKMVKELKRLGQYKKSSAVGLTGVIEHFAESNIKSAMKKMPPITMGDIVSLGLHNYDNGNRLSTVVDGKNVTVDGDGFLDRGLGRGKASQRYRDDTIRFASDAVHAGIEDVKRAFELAQKIPKLSANEIVQRLKGKDGKFKFERYIPSEDKTRATPLPRWKFKTVDDLLDDPKMRTIIQDVVESNIDSLKEVGKDLNGIQRKALLGKGGVIDQFKADPMGTFDEILAYND